ncbi:hypothetical protein DLAC_10132 [Tieghemostelium lacteum]|uniref:Transmembrane protein n=1 Tax=Tieghemostelium lacteum TaxID=361077 RepID=A0A151Z671_TIELA|nr:hypothetical protein DLAC_10132 [Tieghemostelium lacteum]|eukprot:KYQ89461.1 hypothetical protein DLAC_10132 [Tieghemostelium lacteum]
MSNILNTSFFIVLLLLFSIFNFIYAIDFTFDVPGSFTFSPGAIAIDNVFVGSPTVTNVNVQISVGLSIKSNFTIYSNNSVDTTLLSNDTRIDTGGGWYIGGALNTQDNFLTDSVFHLSDTGSYSGVNLVRGGCEGLQNQGSFQIEKSTFAIYGSTVNSKTMNLISSELLLAGGGNSVLDSGSTLVLTKSTLKNNGPLYTVDSQITLDSESSFINNENGDVILQNDIQLVGGDDDNQAQILNLGLFSVEGRSPVNITVPVINQNQFHIKQDVFISKIDSSFNMWITDNKTLSTTEAVSISRGTFNGNGTVSNSLDNSATVGSHNTTSNLHITGNYTELSNATNILFTIANVSTYSVLEIDQNATFSGGNITIRINQEIQEKQNVTILTHANKQGKAPTIKIFTYNPTTGEESTPSKNCHQTEHSNSKFEVLLNFNDECTSSTSSDSGKESKGLTKAQIAGIVIGSVGAAIVITIVVSYTLYNKYKYTQGGISFTKKMMSLGK